MKRRAIMKGLLASGLSVCKLPAYGLRELVAATPVPQVKRVLVVFKCHFDVGFTDTQARVLRKYFDEYYPGAMDLATTMRRSGDDRYVWTTGSWLLYEYLEQATSEQRKRMEGAIAAGDIAWHALPFSWQTEMLDRSMIQGALGISRALDRRFGRTTQGAKMTDVPCHTRGLISPLSEGGIKFLDIGVNPASTAPDIPELFDWKNPGGDSLIVMCHRKNYGGIVMVPGSNLAVAIEVRGDNSGNFSIEEVSNIYSHLRARFPAAHITASNLNEIAVEVSKFRNQLPVVTREIGDTWIYGVPSDPVKVARFRELARLRQTWIDKKHFTVGDSTDLALLRRLLLAPEHTWGTDSVRYLDNNHYKPEDLQKAIDTPGFQTMATSWAEKRNDLDQAVATLPEPLRHQALQSLGELKAVEPSHAELSLFDISSEIKNDHFVVAFDPRSLAIRRLHAKKTQREWASANHLLALFTYQTLSPADYDSFLKAYVIKSAPYAYEEFGKPGFQQFGPQSREWQPVVDACWSGRQGRSQKVLARLKIDDAASKQSGLVAWPETIYLEYQIPDDKPVIHVSCLWFRKQQNRLPEAMWLSFQPLAPVKTGWLLDKVDQAISPYDVVRGGNRHMHAISSALNYQDDNGKISIATMDAPVVALGRRSSMYFSDEQPNVAKGFHFSLFNNAWGTNYIQWFGEPVRFRFSIKV
jgi:Domain of unknown function (DUF5054)